jgi:hypothetical protein
LKKDYEYIKQKHEMKGVCWIWLKMNKFIEKVWMSKKGEGLILSLISLSLSRGGKTEPAT